MASNHHNEVASQLQQDYVLSFSEKISAIKVVQQDLLVTEHIDESLKILQNTAYKIAGSCGAYGFEQISSIAGDIEFLCMQYISKYGQVYHQESIDLIQKYLDRLIIHFQAHM